MPRNDEGEFELVLGNRQLLSGFFIVVILFGVFFTMGYIVGRHSSPAPLAAAPAGSAGESAAVRPGSPAAPSPGQAEVMPAESTKAESAPPESSEPPVTRPATAPPESPRGVSESATEPKRAEPVRTSETHAAGSGLAAPAPGSYLQVAAPKRTAAGAVVESLRNKGIAAVLAPGPNEETVRVLVGPLEAANVGKMRADLESAGFKPFAKRY